MLQNGHTQRGGKSLLHLPRKGRAAGNDKSQTMDRSDV